MTRLRIIVLCAALMPLWCVEGSLAWNDETHIAIARAAGYEKWYNAAGVDMIKLKAENLEKPNHYFNNNDNIEVERKIVLDQVKRYDAPRDDEGHLYGAIIASIRDFSTARRKGKYAEYHLALTAHYLGDLSQPLHNTPNDQYNKSRHGWNDGVVEEEVLANIARIRQHMYEISLSEENFERDLAGAIARIANSSRELGYLIRKEGRDMTKDEAYVRLSHSASLLKAVLKMARASEVKASEH